MRSHPAKITFVILSFLLFGPRIEAQADYLVGVSYTSGQLISIDPQTGVGTQIGSLSAGQAPYGLASNGGRLYTFDAAADVIRQINPLTGATQSTFNVGIAPAVGQGGLAIRADGIGFLNTILDTNYNPVNDLYSFNLVTKTSKLILQGGPNAPTIAGLAFIGNTLYGLGKLDNTLYTINTTTGLSAIVGSLFANPNDPSAALGSPIESLTSGPGGVLYATLDDRLFRINPLTGLATSIDPDPTNDVGFSSISGIAYISVPEPSSFVLAGIGVISTLVVARTRRSST